MRALLGALGHGILRRRNYDSCDGRLGRARKPSPTVASPPRSPTGRAFLVNSAHRPDELSCRAVGISSHQKGDVVELRTLDTDATRVVYKASEQAVEGLAQVPTSDPSRAGGWKVRGLACPEARSKEAGPPSCVVARFTRPETAGSACWRGGHLAHRDVPACGLAGVGRRTNFPARGRSTSTLNRHQPMSWANRTAPCPAKNCHA